jgi:hypothetical protein
LKQLKQLNTPAAAAGCLLKSLQEVVVSTVHQQRQEALHGKLCGLPQEKKEGNVQDAWCIMLAWLAVCCIIGVV